MSSIRRRLLCLDETRRAKTDAIDGETLLRERGEPRVCAVTVPLSPSEEDCRRIFRERATLLQERIRYTNRIRGLLCGQARLQAATGRAVRQTRRSSRRPGIEWPEDLERAIPPA